MNIETLAKLLIQKEQTLATVESCTGGGIAYHCTALAGSSEWFLGGLVTYSNQMKIRLGVSEDVILDKGAVSLEVVEQMVIAGRSYCASDWAVSVSGIAGPGGGSVQKPVGTVCFGWCDHVNVWSEMRRFDGDREAIREQSVEYSLGKLMELIKE